MIHPAPPNLALTYSSDENLAAQRVPVGELEAELVALEDREVLVGVVEEEHVGEVPPGGEVLLDLEAGQAGQTVPVATEAKTA